MFVKLLLRWMYTWRLSELPRTIPRDCCWVVKLLCFRRSHAGCRVTGRAGIYGTQPKWNVEQNQSLGCCWDPHWCCGAVGINCGRRVLAATEKESSGHSVGVYAQNHGLRRREQFSRIGQLPGRGQFSSHWALGRAK